MAADVTPGGHVTPVEQLLEIGIWRLVPDWMQARNLNLEP